MLTGSKIVMETRLQIVNWAVQHQGMLFVLTPIQLLAPSSQCWV